MSFDSRIAADAVAATGSDDRLAPLRSLLDIVRGLAGDEQGDTASQHRFSAPGGDVFSRRYAAANRIARRRADALLREAETVAGTGLKLLLARPGHGGPSTMAAARFLGRSIGTTIERLDELLPPAAG